MSVQAILAPLFAQVFLAFFLLFWMGRVRFAAARAGEVKPGKGSPRSFAWPEKAQKVSDCFHNQLELPIFFYVLVILALATRHADLLFVLMAWVFVATRYLHAFEHTGANVLKRRFQLFVAGFFVLGLMWLIFAVRLFTGL